MKKQIALLATSAMIALTAPAFAADESYKAETKIEKDADGDYSKKVTEKGTDAAGTDTSAESKTEVDVDSKGNSTVTNTTETVKDPQGLGNKEKVKIKHKVKHENGKTITTHKKSVNGDTVEDSKTETPQ